MKIHHTTLLKFFNRKENIDHEFSPQQWEFLTREARATKLLSSVAVSLKNNRITKRLPEKIETQMCNARRIAVSSARSVRWEVQEVYDVLAPLGIPFVLLKGAAYEMACLPPAEGRLFVDVDIMVAEKDINQAETKFIQNGWMATKLNAYDQKYYRTWMHEIPPLRNIERGTSLDVHHTILPPTARLKPDVSLLWAMAVELPEFPGAFVLGPEDMLLHSATHLFHDGDLAGGLRDLVDLDALMRFYCVDTKFIDRLINRAQQLGLLRPLYYMLRYSRRYLATPIPDRALLSVEALARPSFPIRQIMDFLVSRAFYPEIKPKQSLISSFSRWLLYVRSHYLRMPLYLLLPHLVRKAVTSEEE